MGTASPDSKDGPEKVSSDELNNAEKVVMMLMDAQEGEEIPGNLWLQKELFKISRELEPLAKYFNFEPHLQGPFSETANNILENLQYMGLVERNWRGITLTHSGKSVTEDIKSGTQENLLELIENVKDDLNDLSKDELLVYIYYTHEDMTTASLEKEDLEEKRERVAKHLYDRNKVDFEKAVDLAGVSESQFKDLS